MPKTPSNLPVSHEAVSAVVRAALCEDLGPGDVTSSQLFADGRRIRARIVAKAPGVLAGGQIAAWTFGVLDPSVRTQLLVADGGRLRAGQTVMMIEGSVRAVFAAERTALNLVGHLSGVATLTRRFVDQARPYKAKVLDTRKTLPGLRILEKYAVRMGGGTNHRLGLYDAILIKTNHLKVLAGPKGNPADVVRKVITRSKAGRARLLVEIEVSNLEECRAALTARPDAILLDNMSPAQVRAAVALRGKARRPLLEVSGGVTLSNVHAMAATGVDRISVGRLTHSAPSLDLSLQVL